MLAYMRSLSKSKILKHIRRNSISSKVNNKTKKYKPQYPIDCQDRKFVDLAIATDSKHIICDDHHFHDIGVIRYNGNECIPISPSDYLDKYC